MGVHDASLGRLHIYAWVCASSGLASLIACVIVVLVRGRRFFGAPHRVALMWLFVCDGLAGLSVCIGSVLWMFSDLRYRWWCYIVGDAVQFFYLCTFCWTAVFSFERLLRLSAPGVDVFLGWTARLRLPSARVLWEPAVAFGVPLLLTAITAIWDHPTEKGDPDSSFCMFDPQSFEVWRLVVFFTPLLVCLTLVIVNFVRVSMRLSAMLMMKGRFSDKDRSLQSSVRRTTAAYVAVFVLCWLPSILAALINNLDVNGNLTGNELFPLYLVMGLLSPAQGIFNVFVYNMEEPSVANALAVCCSCLPCVSSAGPSRHALLHTPAGYARPDHVPYGATSPPRSPLPTAAPPLTPRSPLLLSDPLSHTRRPRNMSIQDDDDDAVDSVQASGARIATRARLTYDMDDDDDPMPLVSV